MKANETKLQPIIEGTKQYVVPMFQRVYSWDRKEWQALWDDLCELCEDGSARPHFIGSIVTMPTRSVPEGVTKYLLIDGQQRLTTLFVLLSVLRDRVRELPGTLAQQIEELLLKNRYQAGLDEFKLLPTQGDRSSFVRIVEGRGPEGDDAVSKAYRHFDRCLRSSGSPGPERLKNVIVGSLVLVSIVLDLDDNPHLIFESLNAKGRPLSQADLIRNYFFMRTHVDHQEALYASHWKPMQDLLGDNLTEFIRHFLIKDGTEVRQGDVYLALKARAERKSDQEVLEYLIEIATFATYYAALLEPEREPSADISSRLQHLNRIEVTSAYPFLLNVYHDYAMGLTAATEFAEIIDLLENFVTRRFVCGVPTNQLNKIFPTLHRQAVAMRPLANGVRNVLRTRNYPTDAAFMDRFATTQLYGSGERLAKTRVILERLEESSEHQEPPELGNLTIEHVMPQTLSDWWREYLGDNWEIIHGLWVDTIGNLTLSGYNAEMSNGPFPAKRETFSQSHLELNRCFAGAQRWDEAAIRARGEALAAIALRVWPHIGDGADGLPFQSSDVTGREPVAVVIMGDRFSAATWRDVAQHTLQVISDLDPYVFEEIVDRYPRLLGTDPSKFRSNRQITESIYMETNLSAMAIQRFCIEVTQCAGLGAEDWAVELR